MFWALSQTSLGHYNGILPGHNHRQTSSIYACYLNYLAWLQVREVVGHVIINSTSKQYYVNTSESHHITTALRFKLELGPDR
jgi:hypothetical protein